MSTRLLKQYSATLIVGAMFLWFFAYSAALTFLNRTPPAEEQLTTLKVQFLRAQSKSPQLSVVLPDGTTTDLLFPQLLYGIQAGSVRINILSEAQNAALHGCKGTVSVAPIKWLIPEGSFVWHLECGAVSLSYDKIVSGYARDQQDTFLQVMWLGVAFFGLATVVAIFLREAGVLTEEVMNKFNKRIF